MGHGAVSVPGCQLMSVPVRAVNTSQSSYYCFALPASHGCSLHSMQRCLPRANCVVFPPRFKAHSPGDDVLGAAGAWEVSVTERQARLC